MPAFYVNGMFTDASPPALNISGFEPCQHRDAIQWHQEHRTSWIKVLPISAECDAGVESVQRSTLYVSFGPRNSSTGRCENVSLILKRRFPFDAGSSEAISYRKTFSSFPEIAAIVIWSSQDFRAITQDNPADQESQEVLSRTRRQGGRHAKSVSSVSWSDGKTVRGIADRAAYGALQHTRAAPELVKERKTERRWKTFFQLTLIGSPLLGTRPPSPGASRWKRAIGRWHWY